MWWHTMMHGRGSEGVTGEWSGKPVPFTLSQNMVYPALLPTIKADVHTSAVSSWLNWCPQQFKWTCPFCWKTKSGFYTCAITFQLASTRKMDEQCSERKKSCFAAFARSYVYFSSLSLLPLLQSLKYFMSLMGHNLSVVTRWLHWTNFVTQLVKVSCIL